MSDIFTFDPNDANRLWPDGIYPATVVNVETTTSRAGNSMLKVRLEAYHGTEKKSLWDYFVRPAGLWKLEQLADALDSLDEFRRGTIHTGLYVGRAVEVRIGTKDDADFGKHNRIVEYRKLKNDSKAPDPEVPF